MTTRTTPGVQVQTDRGIAASASDYARERVAATLAHAPAPVLHARVRLSRHDHELPDPVVAQANVDVNGRGIRVQVRAATARAAVDLLADRLRARLDRTAGVLHDRWNGHDRAARRAPDLPAPESAPIVRHKSVTPEVRTTAQAIADLEFMDYTFHVYVDAASGLVTLLHRDRAGEYRVRTFVPFPGERQPVDAAQAVELLDRTGDDLAIFRDAGGRSCIVYRRLDGRYGLITLAG